MARYGPIYAYWSKDWEVECDDVLKKCASIGADCVQFRLAPLLDWSEQKQIALREFAKDLDIEMIFGGGLGENSFIYSKDPSVKNRGINTIIDRIKQASFLGAKTLNCQFVTKWNTRPDGILTMDAKKDMMDRAIESLKETDKVAKDYGIVISQEITNRFEGFLLNTAAEAVYVAEGVGSENFKITFDTFHMNIEEDSIEEGISTLGKYLGLVHLGEANRKLPGMGSQIDWDKVLTGLKRLNYNGAFIMEAYVIPGGTVSLPVSVWRDLSGAATQEKLTEDLVKSIKFIKDKFENM